MQTIQSAYTELKNLGNGFIYTIAQINWWLLKYEDLYKTVSNSYSKLCNACLDWRSKDLPIDCISNPSYCNKKPEFHAFIKFYDELDEATQLNKLEIQCVNANDEYLLCYKEDLRDWVIKHYDIYNKLGTYFYSYLGFNSKDDKNLDITEAPDKSFGVVIREEDFKSAIRFYDVFHDLYHNKKLYPEKIKEWEEIFAKIPFQKDVTSPK